MELSTVKKYINDHMAYLSPVLAEAETAERYYDVRNDILLAKRTEDAEKTALRNADNRVCSAFFPLLIDQKAAYAFTAVVLFDTGDEKTDQQISDVLGEGFPRTCKRLCKNASLAGIAWLHYWNDNGAFRYAALRGDQVIPVCLDDLNDTLLGVIRVYRSMRDDGKPVLVYEVWNDTECEAYEREEDAGFDTLAPRMMFSEMDSLGNAQPTNVYRHGMGRVPFIPFANNDRRTGDLKRIKGLIDSYDKTFNGFANDLEDIQEVILVLTGYSGTDLAGFLENLKKYKTVKIDDGEGGVSTLNIDIPVEAREKMLELTRKAIFMQGQGVDPDPQNFGNASGVALQFLYALLELKVGELQTEFMPGFGELIRAICDFYHFPLTGPVIQTWTRTAVRNDTELSQIAVDASGILSQKTILKNHPFVEDAAAEIRQIEKEAAENAKAGDAYAAAFTQRKTEPEDPEETDDA